MVCHKMSKIWSLRTTTQFRARNADHKTKYKYKLQNTTKYRLTTPRLFPMGILQKEYCTIFQYPDGCNADQGSLILATGHTHKQNRL